MKLLLVVNSYLPDEKISARRWGLLVPELQRLNFDCTVLSPGDGTSSDCVGEAGERVIRLPISNRRSGAITKGGLWRSFGRPIARDVARYFVPHYFFKRRMQTWRLAVKSNPAVLGATVGCDAVIASYGPISTILLGAELSRQYKKPYIVDIRDSFKAMEKKSFFPSSWFSRRLEKRLLATSSERTTVGVNLGKFLKDQYNLNFQPIYNGWSDRDMLVHSGEDRQRVGRKEKPYLYYAGTLYPHRLKALSLVLKALRHVDLRLRLRIVNYHIASILQRFVEAHDVCDQVDLWSPVSTEIVSNEMAISEGLLVLENVLPTSLHDGNVTGKLLGVLASGVPGVAVCSPTSEIQRIVEDVEGWSAVSTEMACLDAIRALIRGPRSVVSRKGIGAYHVTAQAKNLRDVIERAVASGSERR